MSRRRSRVTPTAGVGSEIRELTIDDFLRVLAKAPRAPRVSRKRPRHIVDATTWKTSKAMLITPGLASRPDVDRVEATILLDTLSAVGRDAGNIEKPSSKTKKPTQRMNTDDIEWNTLIGGVDITKQKRRKHYVVYNSLPLSRDTDIEEFQQGIGRERDKCVLEACARSTKPLIPISILRGMIDTPKLARMTVPGKVVGEGIGLPGDVSLGRLRNQPGSGFDWLAGSEQIDSSTGRGVLDMAVPLPSMPETLYGQLNIQISEVGTLDNQPPSSLIHSTFTAKNCAANDSIAYHEEMTTRLEIIHQESQLCRLTQEELLPRDSYEPPQLQINTRSEKFTAPVLNCAGPSYGDPRRDPTPKLTVEAPPMPHFSLGRVDSGTGGRSKINDSPSQGSVDREDTEEGEYTLPVSRRLFTQNPESSYFSIAQRCLNSSSGAIDYNSLDYLRRPKRRALQFPTVNKAINEEDERHTNENEDEDEKIIVRNTNLAQARVGLSRQRSIATTPITLKELLNRSGRRRTSISGIFHKKGVESIKQFEKCIPYPDSLPSSHKAGPGLMLASNPISSPIGSKPFSVYASRRTSTKVHRPYVSPLGRLSEPKETMEVRRPVGKLGRGVTMAAGAETETPVRKRFKPPLLKSRARNLLQSGGDGTLPKHSWTNALENDRDPGSMAESQIDMQSISSFHAVQEAW
ncbi:hypothetical protein DFP73DRAFT_607201 [Morchella snyderi]|nr:hypothetical protein DFP73DRAFT_607201 [Morchella snyderi]